MPPSHRILIVDDSESIRQTLKLTLEFKGYDVTEAEDGQQALSILGGEDFDLVFCDLAMPGLNGEDVIRRVRGDLKKTEVPIIVLSAEEREAKVRAMTAGANGFVDKPFSPQQILEIVARTLG